MNPVDSDIDTALAVARSHAAPSVARPANLWFLPLAASAVVLLGVATFVGLQASRPQAEVNNVASGSNTLPASAALPPPPALTPAPKRTTNIATAVAAPVPTVPAARIEPAPPPPTRRSPGPALVIDSSVGERSAGDATKAQAAANDRLSSNEQFADRLSRAAPESVGTDRLASTDLVIPQGTIIAAVLETAINSDLPGLVRAVVSRDVAGFDGSKILIPQGSRLIGQYSSGVALGQSRAFIIWTRVLRGDGVSVQLVSAATDQLGTAGLGGKVDTHFLKRFGAATLLSVISGGIDYLANSARGSSQVLIGNVTQANQLASIALQRQIDIAPTIKVMQGTPVRVFVARDLDFGKAREKTP